MHQQPNSAEQALYRTLSEVLQREQVLNASLTRAQQECTLLVYRVRELEDALQAVQAKLKDAWQEFDGPNPNY